MTKKPFKSIRTLADESKDRRKTKLTPEQIGRLNGIFKEIESEQEKPEENPKRKIARQPEA